MAPADAFHAQSPAHPCQQAADAAHPHNAHGFARQLHLFSLGPDPPVPLPVLLIHFLQILGTGKNQGQGMFRHAPGVGSGSQHHRDAPFRTPVHRDVFKAHPRTAQHLQVPAPAEDGFRTFFQPDDQCISAFQKSIRIGFPVYPGTHFPLDAQFFHHFHARRSQRHTQHKFHGQSLLLMEQILDLIMLLFLQS